MADYHLHKLFRCNLGMFLSQLMSKHCVHYSEINLTSLHLVGCNAEPLEEAVLNIINLTQHLQQGMCTNFCITYVNLLVCQVKVFQNFKL